MIVFVSPAQASSCGKDIDKVQLQVDARIDAIAKTDPGARESRAALLHHEPTPASIAAAERGLKGDARVRRALAALKRARSAEVRGDTKACETALADARAAIAKR
ncbi:hypothetical protein [uncultured Methylovirgula sp.]|uniref:hypothetical protein n=1 Tax=uncultured Methylovirgula sp. TaxID=1285960 RepID=UPI00263833E6|nr:hypothetical protein [uncultured Methylovirgula sp.]